MCADYYTPMPKMALICQKDLTSSPCHLFERRGRMCLCELGVIRRGGQGVFGGSVRILLG